MSPGRVWQNCAYAHKRVTPVKRLLENLLRKRLQLELAEGVSSYLGKWSALTIHDYMIPGSGDGITVSLQ